MRVDSTAKIAELELAEKVCCVCVRACVHVCVKTTDGRSLSPLQEKMREKIDLILKHNINCFINRYVCLCTYFLCVNVYVCMIVRVVSLQTHQAADIQLSRAVVCRCWRHGD